MNGDSNIWMNELLTNHVKFINRIQFNRTQLFCLRFRLFTQFSELLKINKTTQKFMNENEI